VSTEFSGHPSLVQFSSLHGEIKETTYKSFINFVMNVRTRREDYLVLYIVYIKNQFLLESQICNSYEIFRLKYNRPRHWCFINRKRFFLRIVNVLKSAVFKFFSDKCTSPVSRKDK